MMKNLSMLLLVFAAVRPAEAQSGPPIDHFKCYYQGFGTPVTNPQLFLQDQFDSSPQQVFTTIIARFCNPVEKTSGGHVSPILNRTHHLMMFHFDPQPIVAREVVVSNQFGRQRLSVRDAQILAAPTNKSAPNLPEPPPGFDPPLDLSHFKCYSACGRNVKQRVRLRDQFNTESVTVAEPVLFCNPAVKTRDGLQYPIVDPRAHLTCYAITPPGTFQPTWNPGEGPFVKNQFQLNRLHDGAKVSDLLCVPSFKLSVTGP